MAEGSRQQFMSPSEARAFYDLQVVDSAEATAFDRTLAEQGVVRFAIPLADSDFQTVIDGFEDCLNECPEQLSQTRYQIDERYGNMAGHERKEREYIPATGKQKSDPKHLIHFTEG